MIELLLVFANLYIRAHTPHTRARCAAKAKLTVHERNAPPGNRNRFAMTIVLQCMHVMRPHTQPHAALPLHGAHPIGIALHSLIDRVHPFHNTGASCLIVARGSSRPTDDRR